MIPELSIVIPVLNESPNIKPLYDELTQTLGQYGRSYELLIVDDGSTDDTFEQLAALQARQLIECVVSAAIVDDQDLVASPELAHGLGQFVIKRLDVRRLVLDGYDDREVWDHQFR